MGRIESLSVSPICHGTVVDVVGSPHGTVQLAIDLTRKGHTEMTVLAAAVVK